MLTCDYESITSYKLQLWHFWPSSRYLILIWWFDMLLDYLTQSQEEQSNRLERRAWSAVWIMSVMSTLASDVWLSYLIQTTEDHDREGDYQADIIPSGVVTLVFNSLRLSADNEVFLAPWLDSAMTCLKFHFEIGIKYTWRVHIFICFIFEIDQIGSLPDQVFALCSYSLTFINIFRIYRSNYHINES